MAMTTTTGEVVVRFRADAGGFTSTMQQASGALKGVSEACAQAARAAAGISGSMSGASSSYGQLSNSARQMSTSLSQVAITAQQAAAAMGGLNQTAQQSVSFGAQMSSAWNAVSSAAKVATGMFLAWRASVYAFNVIAGPFIGALTTIADKAMEFELAWAGARRTVQGTAEEMETLREEILDLSTEIPVAAKELARIASVGGQMGIAAPDIKEFTDVVARMSETFEMSGDKAAMMMARIGYVNKIPVSDYRNLASSIVAVGDAYNTNTNDLMRTMLQMQAMGSQAGLTAQQMIAMGAVGMSSGQRVESFGTAVGRIAFELSKVVATGGSKLAAFAQVARLSSDQMVAAWREDKMGAIFRVFAGIQAAGEKQAVVLDKLGMKNIRVVGAILSMTTNLKDLQQAYTLAIQAMEDGAALNQKSDIMFGTTAKQVELLRNQFERASIELGTAFLPVMKEILATAIPVMQELTEWLKRNKTGIEEFAQSFRWLAGVPGALSGFVSWLDTVNTSLRAMLAVAGRLYAPLSNALNLADRIANQGGGKNTGTSAGKYIWDIATMNAGGILGNVKNDLGVVADNAKAEAAARDFIKKTQDKVSAIDRKNAAKSYLDKYGPSAMQQFAPKVMAEFADDPEFQEALAQGQTKEQIKEEEKRAAAEKKRAAEEKRKNSPWLKLIQAEDESRADMNRMSGPAFGVGHGLSTEGEKSFGAGAKPVASGTYGGDGFGFFPLEKMALEASARGEDADDIKRRLEAAQLPAAQIESIMDSVRKQMKGAKEEGIGWRAALEGVSLLAGMVGGKFGQSLEVVENLGRQFESLEIGKVGGKWSGMSDKQKLNAKLGLAGQAVSMVGGLLQNEDGTNAAAGAMQGAGAGAAAGSAFGPIGAGVGAVIGGIAGFLGAKKKQKQMMDEMKKSLVDQFGSLDAAKKEAEKYGINLQKALDSKKPKELEKALNELQKRSEAMAKVAAGLGIAQEGVRGLVNAFYIDKEAAEKAGIENPVNMFANPTLAKAGAATFSAVFWKTVKEKGFIEATATMRDVWDKMMEGLKDAGIDANALGLGSVGQLMGLSSDSAFAQSANAASAMGQVVTGMTQAGYADASLMANASSMAGELQNQAEQAAIAAGMAPADATKAGFQAIQPLLQAQLDAAIASGDGVSADLQALLDEAKANGVEILASPMMQQLEELRRIRAAVEGGTSTTSTGRPTNHGKAETPREEPPDYTAAAGFGPERLDQDTVIQAHEGEHVAIWPKGKKVKFRSARSGMGGPWDEDGPEDGGGGAEGGGSGGVYTGPASVPAQIEQLTAAVTALAEQRVVNVAVAPNVAINENPMASRETRDEMRRFTVAEIESAIRLGQGSLVDTIRRAVR